MFRIPVTLPVILSFFFRLLFQIHEKMIKFALPPKTLMGAFKRISLIPDGGRSSVG
jgi:hypothetical protein